MVPASRTLERRNIGTVVAGSDVDMQMFEYCFPMKNMRREADIGPATLFHLTGHHALATSVTSYPELKQICRYFDAVARKLLQKHNVTEDELRTWQNGLDWAVIRAGIAGCKMGPAQHLHIGIPSNMSPFGIRYKFLSSSSSRFVTLINGSSEKCSGQ